MPRAGLALKMLAGAIVAIATWWRFEALGLSPVGVVLALMLLTVPTVLLLAPLFADKRSERGHGARVDRRRPRDRRLADSDRGGVSR